MLRPDPSVAYVAKVIRNKFAFHYDKDRIRQNLKALSHLETQAFLTGLLSGNIFYSFAENVRNEAMAYSGRDTEPVLAVRRLYDELRPVHGWMDDFSRSLLKAIASRCNMRSESFDSEQIVDLSTIQPIIFTDENAAVRVAKERGLK